MTAAAAQHITDDLPIEQTRTVVARHTGALGYPDDHAIAVAECSLRIADQLGVSPDTRKVIAEGALLHDVGKIQVDRKILDKPGPLTPAERRIIERHPVDGARMIRTAVASAVAAVVRAHHEHWNGAGYPAGLVGAQIPLAARVVAVADAYLAMLEERPYRRSLPKRAALRELRACAGSQFDPECVRALAETF